MNADQGERFVGDDGRASPMVFQTGDADRGLRLDALLAQRIEAVSRARIQRAIALRLVEVDGAPQRSSYRISPGQQILISLPPVAAGPEPEAIPLDLLYEDDQIAVVNKPPGMVVHPAKGHWSGTLASALVHHFGQLSEIGGPVRPGIVHRLDRDTSGVLVVAKTDAAHQHLADQFKARTVEKEYLAIVAGSPDRDRDRIDGPIGPHPTHREKMAIRPNHADSRQAETFYEVHERFPGFALIAAHPKTGRTHQIRVHLAYVGCPVLCDRLYGGRAQLTAGQLRQITRNRRLAPGRNDDDILLNRQALHALRLSIDHPVSGERMSFEAPVPDDIAKLKAVLRPERYAPPGEP